MGSLSFVMVSSIFALLDVPCLKKKEIPDLGLHFAIGGQISIDAFPLGWDKRFCLKYVKEDFKEIHFFGDKTAEGGNDYQLYCDPCTIGHTVKNPKDTMEQLIECFRL